MDLPFDQATVATAGQTDIQLAVEGMLDPRSAEFQHAVKLTPATLATFRTQGKWVPAKHLLYTSTILAHEITLGDARIIVEMPPRHGKSEQISVHTPIWFLEHFPWASILLTSYAADLATGFGRRVRDAFLQDNGAFLKTRIRDDVQRTDHFLTTEGGGMGSVGIGGPITGRGAHLLLVDDYIKNWAEASSDLVLQSIWDWFITTAYTRIEPGGSCVILATRWVLDDLIGRLKAQDKEHMWKVIRLPAFAEEGDPLERPLGQALWPERYDERALNRIKAILGDFIFNAMYQQNPQTAMETKADITKLRTLDQIPNLQQYKPMCRSWDLAATGQEKAKKAKKSDWTVGTLMTIKGRPGGSTTETALLDMKRGRWKPHEIENVMLETAQADGPDVTVVLEQEPGSAGKIAAEHLKNNILRGFKVEIYPAAGANKWIKAQPYIAAVSNGRIQLLNASWNEVHKAELKDFPNVKYDDTVDSAAQGYNHLHQTRLLVPTWGRDRVVQVTNPATVQAVNQTKRISRGCTWGR